ncbi:MAG TPA: DUF1015 family protein [Methanoregulaceae archaeon]|nr:DUF1015 family protein [Methanoregulaceae archaeon]
MVRVYRFTAVRPRAGHEQAIAAVPYDVVSAEEARECIRRNPESFLKVSRADALLPDIPPHDERVYQKAREKFQEMLNNGQLVRDSLPAVYLYRVIHGDTCYLGLCCCLDIDDYRENRIRRHEATRYDKEADRTRHIDVVNAHTGPVVLLYRDPGEIHPFIESLFSPGIVPAERVFNDQGAVHEIFVITEPSVYYRLADMFSGVEVYIADGHHRAKSAVNVAEKREGPGDSGAEAGHFMGVLFSHRHVTIHGYSRLVLKSKKITPEKLFAGLNRKFSVMAISGIDPKAYQIIIRDLYLTPHHVFHMYIGGIWYECSCPRSEDTDPIGSLDVSVLQKEVLEKIFGITDPREDPRLQYLGGARPLCDLEELVDNGDYLVAFSMQPVDVDKVLEIADKGCIMPPKSTWFEPKLLSGLVIHTLD